MTDKPAHDPHNPQASQDPASQTDENQGRIKRPQANQADPDMPRGSESEHQGSPRTRH